MCNLWRTFWGNLEHLILPSEFWSSPRDFSTNLTFTLYSSSKNTSTFPIIFCLGTDSVAVTSRIRALATKIGPKTVWRRFLNEKKKLSLHLKVSLSPCSSAPVVPALDKDSLNSAHLVNSGSFSCLSEPRGPEAAVPEPHQFSEPSPTTTARSGGKFHYSQFTDGELPCEEKQLA